MEPRNGDARFSVADAVSAVAEHFGVTRDEVLRGGLRRRIAAFVAFHATQKSFPQIARGLGGIGRNNVVMSVRYVESMMANNVALGIEIKGVVAALLVRRE